MISVPNKKSSSEDEHISEIVCIFYSLAVDTADIIFRWYYYTQTKPQKQ